jgi:hypothetical protein
VEDWATTSLSAENGISHYLSRPSLRPAEAMSRHEAVFSTAPNDDVDADDDGQ